MRVKAVDDAENIKESEIKVVKTKTVPAAEGEHGEKIITINYDPNKWTNKKVTVIMDTTEKFDIQYAIDKVPENDKGWTIYNKETKFTLSDNSTVYARLWDGNNGGQSATSSLTIIDKLAPTVTVNNVTSTTKKENFIKELEEIHKYCEKKYGLTKKQKKNIMDRLKFLKKVWKLG